MHQDQLRLLSRTAGRLRHHYHSRCAPPPLPFLPLDLWQELTRSIRRRQLAHRNGLLQAQQLLRERSNRQLEELSDRIRLSLRAEAEQGTAPPLPSLRSLFEELQHLHEEFESVSIQLREGLITVQTAAIVLEGIDLGRFDIRLKIADLGRTRPYEVIALDPHPAGCSSETTHPHVSGNVLCEGEGQVPLRTAFAQGRLCDAFLIIHGILNTYNPSSAYIALSEWDGVPCHDCDDNTGEEDAYSCGRCEVTLCSRCAKSCENCSVDLCSECEASCEACGQPFCSRCLSDCPDCDQPFCASCLNEGLCDACLEEQNSVQRSLEEDDEEDHCQEAAATTSSETLSGSSAAPDTHRLVEAPAPA
ncbi:hypothetical protein SH661x_002868 [Planctomicrobium sp. SH661]|uniref:hypothetical protein n=1 Tax=Planctomicrobium sp. SH661 TaxID=3448124 RepID=UPI003F5B9589